MAVSRQWQGAATASFGAPLELLDDHGRLWTRTTEGELTVSEAGEETEPLGVPRFRRRVV